MDEKTETFGLFGSADYLATVDDAATYLEAALDEAGNDNAFIVQALASSPSPATSASSPASPA